jgi:hypothetical protein
MVLTLALHILGGGATPQNLSKAVQQCSVALLCTADQPS